jgi:Lysyl oxidase
MLASGERLRGLIRTRLSTLGAIAVVAMLLSVSDAGSAAGMAAASELLPDVRPQAPRGLIVVPRQSGGATRFELGFSSHVDNIGKGPMIIVGSRPSTSVPLMQASQIVNLQDGETRTVPGVGTLHYQVSEDHQHWHLNRFMTYELRTVTTYRIVGHDQKTGFCLGDRYDVSAYDATVKVKTKPRNPVYTDECGKFQPDLLTVTEGISPGYGDRYAAVLEGQTLDLTHAPEGYYYLVHRVNQDRRLRESNTSNNASSIQIKLTWPNGPAKAPAWRIVSSCPQGDRCPADSGLRATVPVSLPSTAKSFLTRITLLHDANVTVVMRSRSAVVTTWRGRLKAGVTAVTIPLPPRARTPGQYYLAYTASGPGVQPVTRRGAMRIDG